MPLTMFARSTVFVHLSMQDNVISHLKNDMGNPFIQHLKKEMPFVFNLRYAEKQMSQMETSAN